MAKPSYQQESSDDALSNGSSSSDEEQINEQINEEEEDEEELEAVARSADSDDDEAADDNGDDVNGDADDVEEVIYRLRWALVVSVLSGYYRLWKWFGFGWWRKLEDVGMGSSWKLRLNAAEIVESVWKNVEVFCVLGLVSHFCCLPTPQEGEVNKLNIWCCEDAQTCFKG